jgi:hypothetical protein
MKSTRSFLILMLLIADASMNLADEMDQMDDNSTFLTNLTNASAAPTATATPTATPTPTAIIVLETSEIPSASPITMEEKCENTPGWTFGSSILYDCDDDFVWCSDPGATENCCKCNPTCCGLCNSRNNPQDMYQPCKFAPTMRPTGNFFMPTYPTIDPFDVNQDEEEGISVAAMIGIATIAIFLIVIMILVGVNYRQRRDINSIRRTMSERRTLGSVSGGNRIVNASSRFEQITSSFFFETVLPDKSNANALSIRSIRDGILGEEKEDDNSTVKDQECEEGENEPRAVASKRNSETPKRNSQTPKRESRTKRNSQTPKRESRTKRNSRTSKRESRTKRNSLTPPRSLRNVFASWRKPSPKDDCCICLDGYQPGETICLARTEECDHVFHKDCLLEWIKDHDCCPLCRAHLVK